MTRLKDIAEKAGVSIRTVNRVLKDQPNVKPHIISQVKKIAEELQYFPNQTAQSLKKNINNDIVFFTPNISNSLHEVISGIESAIRSYHLNLKIVLTGEAKDKSEFAKKVFSQKPKGVLFAAYEDIADIIKLNLNHTPYIVLQGNSDKQNSIYFDRSIGVKESILYLYKKGARKIAYLGFNKPQGRAATSRLEGYHAGINQCGLQPIYLPMPRAEKQFEIAREIGQNFKSLNPLPDAVQCYSDYAALGFMAGLNDSRLFVKDTVKIVGFNDANIAYSSSPPLTTVALPHQEMGAIAVKTLVENYPTGKKANETIQIKLDTFLKIRETA